MPDACRRCQRPLTDPESRRVGYGPVCAAAAGIEHQGRARAAPSSPASSPRRRQGDLFKDLPMPEQRRAPTWCGYPDPAQPGAGCWSLLRGLITDYTSCVACEFRGELPLKSDGERA